MSSHIATTLSINGSTVLNWRAHFFANGLDSVREVRTGGERKPEISLHLVQAILHATPHETPPGATQLVGCRSTAKVAGVSHATVRRIWDARGLQLSASRRSGFRPGVRQEAGRRRGAVHEPG